MLNKHNFEEWYNSIFLHMRVNKTFARKKKHTPSFEESEWNCVFFNNYTQVLFFEKWLKNIYDDGLRKTISKATKLSSILLEVCFLRNFFTNHFWKVKSNPVHYIKSKEFFYLYLSINRPGFQSTVLAVNQLHPSNSFSFAFESKVWFL